MSKKFQFTLLIAVPVFLTSCGDDISKYNRTYYSSYQQCMEANKQLINQGLPTPCTRASDSKRDDQHQTTPDCSKSTFQAQMACKSAFRTAGKS